MFTKNIRTTLFGYNDVGKTLEKVVTLLFRIEKQNGLLF